MYKPNLLLRLDLYRNHPASSKNEVEILSKMLIGDTFKTPGVNGAIISYKASVLYSCVLTEVNAVKQDKWWYKFKILILFVLCVKINSYP